MNTCKSCTSPAKCREAGKCLNAKKTKKTMAKPKPKPLRGDMNEANPPSTSGGYN